MNKNNMLISVIFGGTAVGLGALGAHFLKSKMHLGLITADQLSAFDTATKYQLFHAIVLLIISLLSEDKSSKWLKMSISFFILGILLFCFSIYFLSTRSISGFQHLSFLGPVTPVGGLLLIIGWILIGVHAVKANRN